MQNALSVITHTQSNKTRVLLVEDNPGDADLAIEQLQDTNIEVVQFQTIQAALEWLSHSSCEAIILDLNLSDSRGLDTLRRIKNTNSDAPTIVVSGLVDQHLRTEATNLGAAQVIAKNDIIKRSFTMSVLHATERSRVKEKEKLAQILDAMPDAIVVTNKDGIIKYVNNQALNFFGWTREEVIHTAFPFTDGTTELKIQHHSGDRVGEMRITELEWQGEPAALATIRDITEQRKLEIQLLMSDRLASLGTLSASIVHEINNPLLAAINNVDLATNIAKKIDIDFTTQAEIDEILTETTEALEQIQQIVSDVKLFSKQDEGRRAVSDVHRVLDSVVRMARNEVRQRAHLIKEYGNVSLVCATDSRLSQVFLNLLVNAAQAIPKGKISENEICIRTYMNSNNEVVIEFKDTGAGIPLQLQDQIFTPFFTTKATTTGTGLGLAICQRIINNLGGKISFESEPGKGTCFRVTLPSSPVAPTRSIQTPERIMPQPQHHILIVDDDEHITRSLSRVLSGRYIISCFNDANDAIQKISSGEHFDAIVSDMMMPTISGIEFYHAVKALNPEQAKKFIFMTGSAAASPNREFLETTTNPFIEKPFKLAELLSLLENIIPA